MLNGMSFPKHTRHEGVYVLLQTPIQTPLFYLVSWQRTVYAAVKPSCLLINNSSKHPRVLELKQQQTDSEWAHEDDPSELRKLKMGASSSCSSACPSCSSDTLSRHPSQAQSLTLPLGLPHGARPAHPLWNLERGIYLDLKPCCHLLFDIAHSRFCALSETPLQRRKKQQQNAILCNKIFHCLQ